MQGIQIYDGQARYNSIDDKDALISRTFIGFNPTSRTLYLLAFEKASVYTMVQRALDAGVKFGAQFDSGSSTTLLVGAGAKGVLAPRRYPQPSPAWAISGDLCGQAQELITADGRSIHADTNRGWTAGDGAESAISNNRGVNGEYRDLDVCHGVGVPSSLWAGTRKKCTTVQRIDLPAASSIVAML